MRFIGALYPVALPTGEFAALYPGSHIESIWGRIDLPGFDILEFDITAAEGGKLAGKAQSNDPATWGTWQYRAATQQWERVSAQAHGTYPCIYAADGTLVLADPVHNGSQGWRYVDENGHLVTGDDTLNAQRPLGIMLGLTDLWEFSHFAGVTMGQGDDPMGCHVLIDGTRRILEPGGCFFIRVKYRNGMWAVGLTKLGEGTAFIYWLTRPQLLMLPLVTQHPIPIPPLPVPPKPEPLPVPDIPDQSAVVAAVRAKYPTPLGREHAACLLEIARAIGQGAGLLKKDSGSNIELPDGTRVSQDVIVFQNGDGYDCLGSGETLATPQWSGPIEGSPFPASRYYAVTVTPLPPVPDPEDPDDDEPEPPVTDTQARILYVLERIALHFGVDL